MDRVLVVAAGAAEAIVTAVNTVSSRRLHGEIVRVEDLQRLDARLDGLQAIVIDASLGERALEVGRIIRAQSALDGVPLFLVGGNDELLLRLKAQLPYACFVGDTLVPALEQFLPRPEA